LAEFSRINALDGQSPPEVREWKFNVVSTYDFRSGVLENSFVGGAFRYEDDAIIGYAPMYNRPEGDPDRQLQVNINAPVKSPSQETFDLWIGRNFKLSDKINWRIALNINNVFGENEVLPISTGVDPVRIQTVDAAGPLNPETVIPMRDGIMLIREGRSWSLTNTLEF